ncbi:integrase [Halococcus salsus]|uniref:integrase n=1 Tax=Halococcus salsus TaxID=2162894 RepID=UPI00135B083E|nr:integrase [Halococcus salsus]
MHQDVNAELVHYMRGDEAGTSIEDGAMHHYIHTYYEDVEDLYLDRVFKLDV